MTNSQLKIEINAFLIRSEPSVNE